MGTVQILDKVFTKSIPESLIAERIARVAECMSRDFQGKNPIFLAVLNGAFMFAADVARALTIPCEFSFVKFASYEGTSSTGCMKELIGLNEDLKGRTVVILEDIVDSGLTMQKMLGDLEKLQPAEVHICALLVKPDNLKIELDIKYRCLEIPNDFIVGYGLDYDGYGRNLRDIYTVVG